jgi:hypothetical protein
MVYNFILMGNLKNNFNPMMMEIQTGNIILKIFLQGLTRLHGPILKMMQMEILQMRTFVIVPLLIISHSLPQRYLKIFMSSL